MSVFLMQQLIWPRRMVEIDLSRLPKESGAALTKAVTDAHLGAVFFVRISPPPAFHAITLSDRVQFCTIP